MNLEGMIPMKKERMNIREKLLLWRGASGMSQRELSEKSGLNNVYISFVETGRTKSPTIETLEKVADGLDISLQQFLFGDPRYPEIPGYDDGYTQALLDIRDFMLYKEPQLESLIHGRNKGMKILGGLLNKLLLDAEALKNFKRYRWKSKFRVFDDGTVAEIL